MIPHRSHRDALYKNRVNPVISNKGGGFILFGDKTALGYNSAFDRINVRRLFLVLEKAIEAAANTQLFEFNDSITRSTFVNIVSPFLRDVQVLREVSQTSYWYVMTQIILLMLLTEMSLLLTSTLNQQGQLTSSD